MLTWANAKAALKTYFDSVATTLTNKTLTNPVINGGSVSGATGSFTTLSASNATTPSVYVTDRITIGGNGINNPSGYNISGTAYGGAIELRTNSATFDRGFRFGIRNNSDGFVPTLSFIETDPTVRVTKPVAITGSVSPSQGVKFPAAQYSSADPNTLDDYEEGTFTPTAFGTTTAGAATYQLQSGKYTKIGRVVHVAVSIAWTGHTGNGVLRISGFPFASSNTRYSLAIAYSGLNAGTSKQVGIYMDPNNITCVLVTTDSNNGTLIGLPIDSATDALHIAGYYEI